MDKQEKTLQEIIVKTLLYRTSNKYLKATREKERITYKRKSIKITANVSIETLKAGKA